MKKKFFKSACISIALSIAATMISFAGMWVPKENGQYTYQNDDGSNLVNCWQWIDGNDDCIAESYYFNESGYCLMNTTTPDGFTVNENGAWVIDGVVQTKVITNQLPATTEAETAAPIATTTTASDSQSWGAKYPYVSGMTTDAANCKYVINTNTGKIHKPSCTSVKDMKAHNTQYFNGDFSALTAGGYSSCGRCRAN